MRADALLKELAAKANNCIMKGTFQGDAVHEASEVMKMCIQIYNTLEAQEKKDAAENKAD